MRVSFVVEGTPVPKARPRFNGFKKVAYTPERTTAYENHVAWKAAAAMRGKKPTELPVHVDVRIFFPIPKQARKTDREAAMQGTLWHCKKCDSDNIFKSITDGAIGIVYKDDSQVCEMTCSKKYSGQSPCGGRCLGTGRSVSMMITAVTRVAPIAAYSRFSQQRQKDRSKPSEYIKQRKSPIKKSPSDALSLSPGRVIIWA